MDNQNYLLDGQNGDINSEKKVGEPSSHICSFWEDELEDICSTYEDDTR